MRITHTVICSDWVGVTYRNISKQNKSLADPAYAYNNLLNFAKLPKNLFYFCPNLENYRQYFVRQVICWLIINNPSLTVPAPLS